MNGSETRSIVPPGLVTRSISLKDLRKSCHRDIERIVFERQGVGCGDQPPRLGHQLLPDIHGHRIEVETGDMCPPIRQPDRVAAQPRAVIEHFLSGQIDVLGQ
jgi:hypothetical protein